MSRLDVFGSFHSFRRLTPLGAFTPTPADLGGGSAGRGALMTGPAAGGAEAVTGAARGGSGTPGGWVGLPNDEAGGLGSSFASSAGGAPSAGDFQKAAAGCGVLSTVFPS